MKWRKIAPAFFVPARHGLRSIVELCDSSRNDAGAKKGKQVSADSEMRQCSVDETLGNVQLFEFLRTQQQVKI